MGLSFTVSCNGVDTDTAAGAGDEWGDVVVCLSSFQRISELKKGQTCSDIVKLIRHQCIENPTNVTNVQNRVRFRVYRRVYNSH